MPITAGALRKQRADVKKSAYNLVTKGKYKELVSKLRKKPTAAGLVKVFSELDRAAKKRVIHPNKSARLKSRLTKLVAGKK